MDKQKVLVLGNHAAGSAGGFHSYINPDADVPLDLKVLRVNDFKSLAEAEIAEHLMRREYEAVVVPDDMDVLEAVRAQHLGKIIRYGPGIRVNGGESYIYILPIVTQGLDFTESFSEQVVDYLSPETP